MNDLNFGELGWNDTIYVDKANRENITLQVFKNGGNSTIWGNSTLTLDVKRSSLSISFREFKRTAIIVLGN